MARKPARSIPEEDMFRPGANPRIEFAAVKRISVQAIGGVRKVLGVNVLVETGFAHQMTMGDREALEFLKSYAQWALSRWT